jgi:predicted deacylase
VDVYSNTGVIILSVDDACHVYTCIGLYMPAIIYHTPISTSQVWKCLIGDEVAENQLLGEIVDVVDVDAPRVPVISRTAGVFFGVRHQRLVKPGEGGGEGAAGVAGG